MPIDGIKIVANKLDDFGAEHDIKTIVNDRTGEVRCREFNVYGLTFKQTCKGKVIITGSLHKFNNKGAGNFDRFSFVDLQKVIKELNQKYRVPLDSKIQNIEYGVNLTLPFPVEDFLNTLKFFNGKPFNFIREKDFDYNQNSRSNYYFKLYNKGKQSKIRANILRVETKVRRMIHIAKYGVRTLKDLTNEEKVRRLTMLLIRDFNNLTCCESVIKLESGNEKEFLLQGLNDNYWHSLKTKKRKQYEYQFSKFKRLINKYNLNTKQNEISEILFREINNLYIELISPINKKRCRVTGYDISMQKTESQYLNISGLRYLRHSKPNEYKKLERRLSSKWINVSEDIRMNEIAHGIRSEYYNNKKIITRLLDKEKSMGTLFDNLQFIDPRRMELARMTVSKQSK